LFSGIVPVQPFPVTKFKQRVFGHSVITYKIARPPRDKKLGGKGPQTDKQLPQSHFASFSVRNPNPYICGPPGSGSFPISHKSVEWTEIMVANKIFNTNFLAKNVILIIKNIFTI
jgi:hypothetical protein